MPAKLNPLICIGLPTWGQVSVEWACYFRQLGSPLGTTTALLQEKNLPIAEARNRIMKRAFDLKAGFLFFLSDDVLPASDALSRLMRRLWDNPQLHLATGVYWTKAWPSSPYLWRGIQQGPYHDWTAGEWFRVDQAGCDCLLMRLSPEIRELGPQWFSTDWVWTKEQEKPDSLATEDFYFYTRARQAGLEVWCDSGVQCLHQDRGSGQLFGLTTDMPQAGGIPPKLPEAGTAEAPRVMIADLGAGSDSPYFGRPEQVKHVRFDLDEDMLPDYRCDLRKLPVEDQTFDLVWSRHTLEHFRRAEAPTVLQEWLRILRVGGELRLVVPNLLTACKRIVEIEAGERKPETYPWWQLYGQQVHDLDVHANGFTPRRLEKLLSLLPGLSDVRVEMTGDAEENLTATARKIKHETYFALVPAWEEMVRNGRLRAADVPGLALEEQAASTDTPSGDSAHAPLIPLAAAPPPGIANSGGGTAAQARRLLEDALAVQAAGAAAAAGEKGN